MVTCCGLIFCVSQSAYHIASVHYASEQIQHWFNKNNELQTSFSLWQLIRSPTCVTENSAALINHIYTSIQTVSAAGVFNLNMENNFAIYSCLDSTQQKARVEHRYCNNLFNWWQILNDVYQRPEIIQSQESLCNDFRTLANIACNLSSIKLRSSEFETRCFNIWGQLALLISKRVWQKSTPWMTNNILASILRYNDAY